MAERRRNQRRVTRRDAALNNENITKYSQFSSEDLSAYLPQSSQVQQQAQSQEQAQVQQQNEQGDQQQISAQNQTSWQQQNQWQSPKQPSQVQYAQMPEAYTYDAQQLSPQETYEQRQTAYAQQRLEQQARVNAQQQAYSYQQQQQAGIQQQAQPHQQEQWQTSQPQPASQAQAYSQQPYDAYATSQYNQQSASGSPTQIMHGAYDASGVQGYESDAQTQTMPQSGGMQDYNQHSYDTYPTQVMPAAYDGEAYAPAAAGVVAGAAAGATALMPMSTANDAYATPNSMSQYGRASYGNAAGANGGGGKGGGKGRKIKYDKNGNPKKPSGKKPLIIILCILLAILVGGGIAAALYIKGINDTLAGNKTEEEQQAIQEKLTATTSFDEPFYMLLIGSDARANDESMGQRSDTNILVRVDPTRDQVTLISIPRDTMINISGYGTCKFNAAYSVGGAAQVIEEASKLCGVPIAHYVEVDFEGVEDLVDAIGGVEVNVPYDIDDPQSGPAVLTAGQQHLDGEAALTFARCRQYVDGDFTRTSNQRTLVKAIIDKVMSLSATELPTVVAAGAKCVSTDLKIQDIYSLAKQFQDLGNITMYSAMVPSTTQTIDGVSYVICDTEGLANMMQIVEAGGDPSTAQASGSIGSSLVDEATSTAKTSS